MRVSTGLVGSVCTIVLMTAVSPAVAATIGSNGIGAWRLLVATNSEGLLTDGTPPGPLVNIPRFPGALNFAGGVQTMQGADNVTVNAQGSISHTTPNNGSDFYAGLFPNRPRGSFTDFGELSVGNGSIVFEVDFDINFVVDGNGIDAAPIFLDLPIFGVIPRGYRYNYGFEATWSDPTDAPQAADVTLSSAFTRANLLNSGIDFDPFTSVLADAGNFGAVTADFGDSFNVTGFFRVTIDKLNNAPGFNPLVGIPPGGPGFGVGIGGDGRFFQRVPEPGSATLFLALAGLMGRRGRRSR